MPKGRGHRFTSKQDRQASHVADSESARGATPEEAKRIGYATVNKHRARARKTRRR